MKTLLLFFVASSVLPFMAFAQDGGEKIAYCTFDTDEGDVEGLPFFLNTLAQVLSNDVRDYMSIQIESNSVVTNMLGTSLFCLL